MLLLVYGAKWRGRAIGDKWGNPNYLKLQNDDTVELFPGMRLLSPRDKRRRINGLQLPGMTARRNPERFKPIF